MTYWRARDDLSRVDRLRRSYYELFRDELDSFLLEHALMDSYQNFVSRKKRYPFVEKRELKPRARIPDVEYESQNAFLVIFLEDQLSPSDKKYIRFFDDNKTTKKNLLRSKTLPLPENYDRYHKHFDSEPFFDFVKAVLPVDYALLIQSDPSARAANRYALSHFHVRIDWPIADAAEDMAKSLRYISKELYEKGEKQAEDIQKKFFEFYGLPAMCGGRRTAAIVAAQYFKRIPFISTVYVGSSESRALIKISECGVSKAALMYLSDPEIEEIAASNGFSPEAFSKHYMVARKGKKGGVFIFRAKYSNTEHACEPADGKLREMKPDLSWITVESQRLLPKPDAVKMPPVPMNVIYS
ncbi:conserved hypothetical protein [Candidatus Desulfarcum epimagneticum]|uniref:Uncharacterized protein n=1 Tax=uncultured Desulfobacteraceae bacterium TaxID=218296 RepID=A0A484HKA6_9BACT|nr:conserved hypothetical protein [uncultured Desulfobacteraceae bacterium]